MSSYPRPAALPAFVSVHPRTLRPLETPPEPFVYPQLPSPLRQPSFSDKFLLTTHVIPAAYPRSYPEISLPVPPPGSSDRQERRAFLMQTTEDILTLKKKQSRGELGPGSKTMLWNCINRYARRDLNASNSTGVTLFLAHANGFPKEIWEPTIGHLCSLPSGREIDEIWSWEAVQHGDSGLINEALLTGTFDWSDNARDILNFLLHYLPSSSSCSASPTHLTRVSTSESKSRKIHGFKERNLVAVGHSYGGTSSTLAAVAVPTLFSALILVDPVISQPGFYDNGGGRLREYMIGALQRRDRWSSNDEALGIFSQIPFFQAWDPAVLKIYVDCGLTPDAARGGVRLKQTGLQEALVFSESVVPQEAWELLERLDEHVELRWILPGDGGNDFGNTGAYANQVRAWRRPVNVSNVMIEGAGHLIPQEKPGALAHDINSFLQRKYGVRKANL